MQTLVSAHYSARSLGAGFNIPSSQELSTPPPGNRRGPENTRRSTGVSLRLPSGINHSAETGRSCKDRPRRGLRCYIFRRHSHDDMQSDLSEALLKSIIRTNLWRDRPIIRKAKRRESEYRKNRQNHFVYMGCRRSDTRIIPHRFIFALGGAHPSYQTRKDRSRPSLSATPNPARRGSALCRTRRREPQDPRPSR